MRLFACILSVLFFLVSVNFSFAAPARADGPGTGSEIEAKETHDVGPGQTYVTPDGVTVKNDIAEPNAPIIQTVTYFKTVSDLEGKKMRVATRTDVIFKRGAKGTVTDLDTDDTVKCDGDKNNLTLSGTNFKAFVSGGENTVTINGNSNKVEITSGKKNEVVVNGNTNKVSVKTMPNNVTTTGTDNTVTIGG